MASHKKRNSRRALMGSRLPEEAECVLEMGSLPECVLLRILVSLPLPHVFRVRLVCKAWNALLSSSHFLQMLALHSPHLHHLPCLAMAPPRGSRHTGVLLYSPCLGTWLHSHFPLPSSSEPAPTPLPLTLCASHGNFVAIAATAGSTLTPRFIRVFNLLTASHHDIISPVPDPVFSSLGMLPLETSSFIVSNLFIFSHDEDGSAGSRTQSFHLVLYEQSPVHHSLCIYTSKADSWRSVLVPTWFRSWVLSDALLKIANDGLLEIADQVDWQPWNPTLGAEKPDLVFWNPREGMIAEYHMESDEWEKVNVASPRLEVEDQDESMEKTYLAGGSVFKCQGGRVVLVCAEVKDERLAKASPLMWREVKGFRVWDLQSPQSRFHCRYGNFGEWVEVARSPNSFWEGYYVEYAESKFKPKFIHDGTSICMTSAQHSSSLKKCSAFSQNRLGRYKPPLVYDLDLDSWSYLPRYGDEADDLVGLFTFKPIFKALAQTSTAVI